MVEMSSRVSNIFTEVDNSLELMAMRNHLKSLTQLLPQNMLDRYLTNSWTRVRGSVTQFKDPAMKAETL
jgi:hypothetical protein